MDNIITIKISQSTEKERYITSHIYNNTSNRKNKQETNILNIEHNKLNNTEIQQHITVSNQL